MPAPSIIISFPSAPSSTFPPKDIPINSSTTFSSNMGDYPKTQITMPPNAMDATPEAESPKKVLPYRPKTTTKGYVVLNSVEKPFPQRPITPPELIPMYRTTSGHEKPVPKYYRLTAADIASNLEGADKARGVGPVLREPDEHSARLQGSVVPLTPPDSPEKRKATTKAETQPAIIRKDADTADPEAAIEAVEKEEGSVAPTIIHDEIDHTASKDSKTTEPTVHAVEAHQAIDPASPSMVLNGNCTIRTSSCTGLGVFAARHLPRGTLIHAEKPLLIVRERIVLTAHIEREFANMSIEDQERYLSLHSEHSRNDPSLERFAARMELQSAIMQREMQDRWATRNGGTKTPHSIFLTNSMGVGNHAGVLWEGSRFNHSCVPNVAYFWDEETRQVCFVTVANIEEGEECMISYLDLLRERTSRQEHLKHYYNFDCACAACTAAGEDPRKDFLKDLEELEILDDSRNPSRETDTQEILQRATTLFTALMKEKLVIPELARLYSKASRATYRGDAEQKQFAVRAAHNAFVILEMTLGAQSAETLRAKQWWVQLQSREEQ